MGGGAGGMGGLGLRALSRVAKSMHSGFGVWESSSVCERLGCLLLLLVILRNCYCWYYSYYHFCFYCYQSYF